MKGSYVLVLDLEEDKRLTIGRLGTFEFPAGLYLYCGSALNGLEARVRRHLRQDKKRHWHIDCVTAVAPVKEVWWIESVARWECRWAETIMGRGGRVVVRGFGSSDCRCLTHLLRLDGNSDTAAVHRALFGADGRGSFGIWTSGNEENSPVFTLGESTKSDTVFVAATRSSSA